MYVVNPLPSIADDTEEAISQLAKNAEQVNKMLNLGIIRPSNSPWASPVMLVK